MKTLKLLLLTALFSPVFLSCTDYGNDDINISGGNNPAPDQKPDTLPEELKKDFEKPNEGSFSETKMLVNLGLNVIAKNTQDFYLQTLLLKNKLESYCQDLEDGAEAPASEKAARDQWEAAMLAYHALEPVAIGPLADRTVSDHIYAWPMLNACGIDQEVVHTASGTFNPNALVNRKGLGAIEYLLFEETLASTCSPALQPQTKAWSQKTALDKKRDRCRQARFLAEDVLVKAKKLDEAWDSSKGNYTVRLINGSVYKSTKEAINAISNAMFAIEKTKDEKLAKPLGLSKECLSADKKCPDSVEHLWSKLSIRAVEAQLQGFRNVFLGSVSANTKAFGFDDFLQSKGHGEISDEMQTALKNIIANAEDTNAIGSMQDQIRSMNVEKCAVTTVEDRQEPICAFYQDLRSVALVLKTKLLVVLALNAPATHQGDND